MPRGSLKLLPGVDTNKTPALNEAAVSECNLIRYTYDRTFGALVQKLGGWDLWYPNKIGSVVRELHPWKDLNDTEYLAVGAEASLQVISNNNSRNITPQKRTSTTNAVAIDTTIGSNLVAITDSGSNATTYDVVFVETPISVGGLTIYGFYPVYQNNGANKFTIAVYDNLGDPINATATVAAGGAVPSFATTNGSASISVTFNAHGLAVGDNVAFPVSTTVGGLTIYGNYTVQSVSSANVYVINSNTTATSTTSAFMNNAKGYYTYYIGVSPPPPGTGFGIGGFGRGGFGTGYPSISHTGTDITAVDWTIDNWGEILISCPKDGPLFFWSPQSGARNSAAIGNGPIMNSGMFIAMPQRQIVAYGSSVNGIKDPLLVRWCDTEDFDVWNGSTTNQAGSYRIPIGSEIVGALQGPQQSLIWTDLGVWSMQYIGYPDVYAFNALGNGMGLIARGAAIMFGNSVYWMAQKNFQVLTGNSVQTIACTVWDVIFQDLDEANAYKIKCASNSIFNEITWFFPSLSGGTGEIDKYVKYNTQLKQWDYGNLSRTAWCDQSVLGNPIGASSDQYLYQHENSYDDAGNAMPSYIQTGYFALSDGDLKMFVDQVWPDMKWGYRNGNQMASVHITFYVTDYPDEAPVVFGPYDMTQDIGQLTPRFRGRLVSVRLESDDVGTFWRIGNIRYRYQPDGKV